MTRHVRSRQAGDRIGVAFLTLVAISLGACAALPARDLGEQSGAGPQLAAATASANATARATPTPTRSGEPLVLGADPRAGSISGGLLYGWKYDGRSGTLTPDPPAQPGFGRSTSPSGRWAAEQRDVISPNGTFIERTDLWLVDAVTGAGRLLYSPPELPPQFPGKGVQPNLNVPPYRFQRTEYLGSWSPDERYLSIWRVEIMSGSADADGRPLAVIDVATGAITDLGYTLYAYTAWRAPHTLAFTAGAGRESWLNKTLSIWTPESGLRALTAKDEVGLAPAWGPDGRLWFASGPTGPYDVPTFFSGRGIGDRSIFSLDLATGRRTSLSRVTGYADEGVRVSDDGRVLLIARRKLDPAARSGESPDSWLELWIENVDGSDGHPLVRVSALNGFGYYGGYSSLASLAWQR